MAWIMLKTNWQPSDGVSNADMNRIEGNTLDLDTRVKTWTTFQSSGGQINGNILPKSKDTNDLGSTSNRWRNIIGQTLFGQYSEVGLAKTEKNGKNQWGINCESQGEWSLHQYDDTGKWIGRRITVQPSGTVYFGEYNASENGHSVMPNAQIMQWGRASQNTANVGAWYSVPIKFPREFKNACNEVALSVDATYGSSARYGYGCVGYLSKTGMTLYFQSNGSAGGTVTVRYIAMGH